MQKRIALSLLAALTALTLLTGCVPTNEGGQESSSVSTAQADSSVSQTDSSTGSSHHSDSHHSDSHENHHN
ncbi:MAG: hypothetical protein LUC48_02790 [Clostridiales bacterium]|nr:hypothetical protein [Clostridiales bacterium]